MSAGPSDGPSAGGISENILLAIGIIGGLLGCYLIDVPVAGSALAGLGGVCAIVWGADAIRRVASYGLGTGVPSIGYMTLSIGIIGALAGLGLVTLPIFGGLAIAGPIVALILAMVFGFIVALLAKKIIGMKIPIMERCTTEIAGAGGLSVLCFSAIIANGYSFEAMLTSVVAPGFIALFFIMNTMAIQHPFNACLGPNENQVRTLKCALSTAFLVMLITGLLDISNPGWAFGIPSCAIVIAVGGIGWFISFRMYLKAAFNEAASVKWAGLWPEVEE